MTGKLLTRQYCIFYVQQDKKDLEEVFTINWEFQKSMFS